ncbi:strawberry notch family protein [Nitratireductor sp. XY-223]|uniref:strawberry notch family protein n=1 Tax=Nitratireductor sp. XY-223 TaxID=2561926 RepID=UPI0010A9A6F3|nr:strawberry notch family protein [Nitratireductor sp. XY-223]
MNFALPVAARARAPADEAACILKAAETILVGLERGNSIEARILRNAMNEAFGGSDAEGFWTWKLAYEACEAAQVLFLRKFGRAMHTKAPDPGAFLAMLTRIAGLVPTHTRRSEESEAFQQFSTPLPLAYVAGLAANIGADDVVLEPSTGTGMLAIFAEIAGARLALNEIAETRAELLRLVFPNAVISAHDAASIDDRLPGDVLPSVALMNPPFSAAVNVKGRMADADFQYVRSALARLPEGGRLVAITGHNFPYQRLSGAVRFTCAIDGAAYYKHGTSFTTRLTVVDKIDECVTPLTLPQAENNGILLAHVLENLRPRARISGTVSLRTARPVTVSKTVQAPARKGVPGAACAAPEAIELAYEPVEWKPAVGADLTDALYEGYALQSIRVPGSQPHPTKLVQSAAMASVAPPLPTYRPHLPAYIIKSAILSDAQLESVIYAGEAHSSHLIGSWVADETFDNLSAAPDDADNAMRFRRGWFLGDGTGCGKGRQVAGVILDNWMKGRRKAVWISKSDKLIEDARRDWSALGQEPLLVQPLSRFKIGTPVRLSEGILFVTYATLRSAEREGKASRLQQIIDWLGQEAGSGEAATGIKNAAGSGEAATGNAKSFDGVIVFDEAHAMANAAGGKGERGEQLPSQQGRAGLRLQRMLPDARIVYVSATGATDVRNLAYAERLGLWGGEDFPFANRSEFVQAVEAGGVAAMEVLARDLKALGLYAARSLSYEGVEVEIVEHKLTQAQVTIYDAYAEAYQIIHQHLGQALEASGVTGENRTLNGQAKSAALSVFESSKQRFFAALLTGLKCGTLIKSIEADRQAGHAAIVQIVSTGEAILERRLADLPAGEWADLNVDLSPRDVILTYLQYAFPTQLYEPYTDEDGNLRSRPAFDAEGNPIQCREALAARDAMIERLASLDPVPGALDRIVQHFGTDKVAEVTGRSRRIVRKGDRLCVENRPDSANLSEVEAFQNGDKLVLVFSDAGGTGRSYHADRGAKNQRLRVHYLLEAGWKADAAIQGLGRSNRTNQAQPPLFRPIATDVKAEKRFLSTIARRLDTLGAITRGQRQTGGQGLFRAEDNLEGDQARAALRQFYFLLAQGGIERCSLTQFEEMTGLKLTFDSGLKDNLPPITTFLNRLLALPIAMQNTLFAAFEEILNARIEAAIAAGMHDAGLETIRAESLTVTDRRTVWQHGRGAKTRLFTIERRDRNRPMGAEEAITIEGRRLLVNERSGRAAVKTSAPSLMHDDGSVERRVRLLRPMQRDTMSVDDFAATHWKGAEREEFIAAWEKEIAGIPEFSTSTFHLVTGLLLPIWRRLPETNARVYRLQTDDGERVIGRMLTQMEMDAVCRNLGIDAPQMSAADAWGLVNDGKVTVHLVDGLSLRRVRVMNEHRIELTGFTSGMVDALKARGLFGEIISWKLRLFVPVDESGKAIFESLTDRWPLTEIADRG